MLKKYIHAFFFSNILFLLVFFRSSLVCSLTVLSWLWVDAGIGLGLWLA